jgi:hypothetical protein
MMGRPVFTSPVFNGSENYDRVAFEADLPRIEAADFGGICNRFTGANCVNPPPASNLAARGHPRPKSALRGALRVEATSLGCGRGARSTSGSGTASGACSP